jgi:hypothetical protein
VKSLFLLALMIASALLQAQNSSQSQPMVGFDGHGNIYVRSDAGDRIIVGNTARCSETLGVPNGRYMACSVKDDPQPENLMPSHKLEVYSRGGVKQTIQPGAPIRDWHFWNEGQQVAVHFGELGGKGMYGLYDSATGRMMQQLAEPSDDAMLPRWAKNSFQIEIESVPTGPQFDKERRMWIAKTLYQIGKLQPGMRRKDLFKILKEEGGLSTRWQRTYVSAECPYFKVDVRFRTVHDPGNLRKEDPEDVIESISRPYLAWSVMD